jgi:hypothetical protein
MIEDTGMTYLMGVWALILAATCWLWWDTRYGGRFFWLVGWIGFTVTGIVWRLVA